MLEEGKDYARNATTVLYRMGDASHENSADEVMRAMLQRELAWASWEDDDADGPAVSERWDTSCGV